MNFEFYYLSIFCSFFLLLHLILMSVLVFLRELSFHASIGSQCHGSHREQSTCCYLSMKNFSLAISRFLPIWRNLKQKNTKSVRTSIYLNIVFTDKVTKYSLKPDITQHCIRKNIFIIFFMCAHRIYLVDFQYFYRRHLSSQNF